MRSGQKLTRRVLHVVGSPQAGPKSVADALRLAGIEVEWCPNVFRALARLRKFGAKRFDAAVVCLDDLTEPEYEFFALARRGSTAIPMFVHASGRSKKLIERAKRMGATGEVDVTLSALRTIWGPSSEPPRSGDQGAGADGEQAFTAQPDSAGSVRVPWVADPDRPRRGRPEPAATGERKERVSRREASPGDGRVDRGAAGIDDDVDAPLLTPEEMELLLSDDADVEGEIDKAEEGMRR